MKLLDLDLADRLATAAAASGVGGGRRTPGRQPRGGRAGRGGRRTPARALGACGHRSAPVGDAAGGQPDLDARQARRGGGHPGRARRRAGDRGRARVPACGRSVRRCGVRPVRRRRGEGKYRIEIRDARRHQRDDGGGGADDGVRCARTCRGHHPGGTRRAGPGDQLVRDVAHAVLVRRRLRQGVQADRPHRRMPRRRDAAVRHGQRHAGPGVRQPGLPDGQRRVDAWRAARRGEAVARGVGRGREPRHHNGFTAGMHVRAGRDACQARRCGSRGGDAGPGAHGASRRTSCTCRPGLRSQPAGRWLRPVR